MAELQELRQRLSQSAEFCQAELWPLVDEFQLKHQLDLDPIKHEATRSLPLIIGGWIVSQIVESSRLTGAPRSVLGLASAAIFMVGLFLIGRELVKIARNRARAFSELQKLRHDLKQRAVRYLSPEFEFNAQSPFPDRLYKGCGLFSASYDRASAEDHCAGYLGQTHFDLIEVATYNRETYRDSKGRRRTRYIPIFKGLLFRADFNKNFVGQTRVHTDRLENGIGLLARTAQRIGTTGSKLKLVELENPTFEASFKVVSTDETEARYLLTPSFMEKILDLKTKYNANLQLSFFEKSVVVAIPHPGQFMEIGYSLKDLTVAIETLLSELVAILEIVEELDLNTRIWNKQQQKVGT